MPYIDKAGNGSHLYRAILLQGAVVINNGWIKLYRKILSCDDLFRSAHTFPVFILLLLLAEHETGKLTIGRFQIAKWLKINPSAAYRALCRLQTEHRIVMKPNNKWTTISICNWHKYQTKSNNKRTTNEQQTNTLQELRIKNKEKELINKKVKKFKRNFGISK
jgi:hypothetical protein